METLKKIGAVILTVLLTIWSYIRQFFSWAFAALKRRVKWHKRNARKKRRPIFHLTLFPVILIYLEILLRLYRKQGVFHDLFYPVIFAISFGFLLSALTSLF